MAAKQREDPLYAKVIMRLESPEILKEGQLEKYIDKRDERSKFLISRKDKLFIEPMTQLLMVRGEKNSQMVAPDCLRAQLLHSAHDVLGHCGKSRVEQHLKCYAWPGKYKDIEDYVKSCEGCAKVKGNYGKNKPQYGHNLKGIAKNEILYLDYIFLPKSSNFLSNLCDKCVLT